jgi:hypothetical protein
VQFVFQHSHVSADVVARGWDCIVSVVVIESVVVHEVHLRSVSWRIGTEDAAELFLEREEGKVEL